MTAKKEPTALLRKGAEQRRSMTAAQFAVIEPLLRISPERMKAARLVLVDGMTYEGAANVIGQGWTRQAITSCITPVWRKFQAYQAALGTAEGKAIPEGWEQVTLVAPRETIRDLHDKIASIPAAAVVPKKQGTAKKVKPETKA